MRRDGDREMRKDGGGEMKRDGGGEMGIDEERNEGKMRKED